MLIIPEYAIHIAMLRPDVQWGMRKLEVDEETIKGALYRIWCGLNRLGDSGAKVVCIDSAIFQLLYCYPAG